GDVIEDPYGPRLNSGAFDFHAGIDIHAALGTDVHAALGGTVSRVHTDSPGAPCCSEGISVTIDHGGSSPHRFTAYLHLNEALVSEGQSVAAGDLIGRSGTSGAEHAHLH